MLALRVRSIRCDKEVAMEGRHRSIHYRLSLFGIIAASLFIQTKYGANADTINIQGSTTVNTRLIEPYKQLIETLSGHTLAVIANKSENGLLALLELRTDLAMISSPLEVEVQELRKLHPNLPFEQLQWFLLADTRVAFVVHPSNQVREASLEQIGQMLAGKITNWKDVGGPDLTIRPVYVRAAGGVTQSVVQQLLKGKPIAIPSAIPVESPLQVVKIVAQEAGALGLAQIRLSKEYKLGELDTAGQYVEQKLSIVSLGTPSVAALAVISAAKAVAEKKLAAAR